VGQKEDYLHNFTGEKRKREDNFSKKDSYRRESATLQGNQGGKRGKSIKNLLKKNCVCSRQFRQKDANENDKFRGGGERGKHLGIICFCNRERGRQNRV